MAEINIREVVQNGAKTVDAIEVYFVKSTARPVNFKNNHLFSMESKRVSGVGVRVIHNGRIGFASSTDMEKLDDVIGHAKTTAQFGQQAKFAFANTPAAPEVDLTDDAVPAMPVDEVVLLGEKAVSAIRASDDVNVDAHISLSSSTVEIANSAGLYKTYNKTVMAQTIEAWLNEKNGDGFQILFSWDTSCKKNNSMDTLISKIKQHIEWSRDIYPLASGQMPVIFTPDVAHVLTTPVKIGCNGFNVLKNISPLKDKIGEKLFDEHFTVTDDPMISFEPDSLPCDGEGTPAQHTSLIEGGVLKQFIWDNQTGGATGNASTGNGMRSYASQPKPGYTNFVIAPGGQSLQSIMNGIDRGIIIYETLGPGSTNPVAGDISVNVGLGFYFEKGKIKGRIKNVMVAGNVYADLKDNLLALSKETKSTYGGIFPWITFRNMSITAS